MLIATCFGPGIEPVSWPIEEARAAVGDLAELSIIATVVDSTRARCELGWLPVAPSLTTELTVGSYRTGPIDRYHL
jgi:hypothetical protein